ncbi:serine hydrolase [uncultured Psychroserpens sp.]|uniref:serine hydrolase domain-containing protein n=1 Tax=uncultured Psychroserpens sp. TaxID=255436 RepID=UPI002603B49A|nr:serine hydrolase domain-containing protein [uncultured Psychroserpens sp.]
MMKKITILLVLLLPTLTFAQEQVKKIDSIVNSKIEENDPGLMVGIVKDGNIIYEKYRGLANLEHQVKVSEKTRSNIASTAKQFTALMILQLSLNNKLSLESDIRTYIPSLYPKVKDTIKIRHLLNHTSGIRDYVDLMSIKNKIWWKQVGLDNDDVIELIEKQEELAFKPGSKYTYSNSGYNILAKIIEKVSEKSFNDYSKQFFEDLGMNETSFVKRYMSVIPNRANPYSDWGYGEWFHTPTITKTNGEGFLYTTLKDQLIYEQALQNANLNNNILLIKSQLPIPNSEITTYGFGLKLKNRLNRSAIHHDGVTHSYHSQTIRFPEEKLTVFIMSNHGNIRSDLIADEIASVLLPKKEIIRKETYDNQFYKVSNDKEQQILGKYISPSGSLIRIEDDKGKTYYRDAESGYDFEITKDSKNMYSFVYNPKMKTVFYKNEMILFSPEGWTKTNKRSPDLSASFEDLNGIVGTYYSSELEMSFELKLTKKNTLKIVISNRDNELDVQILNRNELLADNYIIMKVERDVFDRATDILVTVSNRAKNNRFRKKTNLKFQPKITTENGTIQVTTIGSIDGETSDILLTKNHPNGNEIWNKKFGGKSYDKASSILATNNGYLIIGSTSSYGNGNYDMFVIKTDKQGNKIWQNSYGDFYNEYGYSAEKTDNGYLIKGTKQYCTSNSDIFNRKCTNNVWVVAIDKNGNEISNTVLEEIKKDYN